MLTYLSNFLKILLFHIFFHITANLKFLVLTFHFSVKNQQEWIQCSNTIKGDNWTVIWVNLRERVEEAGHFKLKCLSQKQYECI